MSGGWVAAFAVGWVVMLLLAAVVVVLARQVAELRLRLDEAPVRPAGGASAEEWDDAPAGIALYDRVPAFDAGILHDGLAGPGAPLPLGGDHDQPALLVFHSPGCMSCAGIDTMLERTAVLLAERMPAVRVLSVLALDDRPAERHLRRHGLDGVATVRFDDLPVELRPDATPTLIGIGREALVCAIGRPTTTEDLVEAARACDAPVLTADSDAVRVTEWGQTVPFWEVRTTDASTR